MHAVQILAAAILLTMAGGKSAYAEAGTVTAAARSVTTRFTALAEVEPISLLRIAASVSGNVAGLSAVPGSTVAAGEALARLQGPAIEPLLVARQSAVTSSEAGLAAAQQSLAIRQHKLALHLGTEEMVDQAKAALAEARARLAAAKSALAALQEATTLRSPEAGQVLSVADANGAFVTAGQVLLTLQPANRLWLTASFYGAEAAAIRPGMRGRFEPDTGGPAIPVAVQGVIGTTQPDGGLGVTLAATSPSPGWRSGSSGSLILQGRTETLPAVPTRALILDDARWWVMIATAHGSRRQAVTPGPAEGDFTLIRRGLKPGARVVVEDAYLDFHSNVANSFQQPD